MKLFSKSSFTKGCQCPRMIWLDSNKPEVANPDLMDAARLENGNEIGELARKFFSPRGPQVTISQSFDFADMARQTEEAIASGVASVCEATFIADGFVCMVDILLVDEATGEVTLVEVKSGTKVKPYYIADLAFQTWVVEQAGYTVKETFLMYVNAKYVMGPSLNLHGFFTLENMTDAIRSYIRTTNLESRAENFRSLIRSDEEPFVSPGKHCNDPHVCVYQDYCMPGLPKFLLDLSGIGRAKAVTLWKSGVETVSDYISSSKELKDMKLAQIQSGKTNPIIRTDKLISFLEELTYPLYFLDFETVQPAIPKWEGTKPYAQVPTQFSLHWIEKPGGDLFHTEYLAPSTGDPRRRFAEALLEAIPPGGCVTVYNKAFECSRIRELAEAYPDLTDALMALHGEIKDLMLPFQKGWAYFPAQGGSYSIKKVLPALCPDDPALDYHALDGVHNGSEAMEAFAKLEFMDPETEAQTREQLLRYCELDTLAMVKVWERLVALAI